jgi:RNA polymerase sigma-70 factor (ECF subfamily)
LANHHRGARRRQGLYDKLTTELASSSVSAGTEHWGPDRQRLVQALGNLNDRDRELLTLVGWDGLSHDEIAAILECSNATIRVRLHRARKRFARQLNQTDLQRTAVPGHGTARGASALPDLEEA